MTDLGTIAQATAALHGGGGMEAKKIEELVALIAENGPGIMAGTVGAGPYVVAITNLIKWNGAPPDGEWKNILRSIVGPKPLPAGIIPTGPASQGEFTSQADEKTLSAQAEVKAADEAKKEADEPAPQLSESDDIFASHPEPV